MKNRLLQIFIAGVAMACVCWVASVQAAQITGGLSMGGAGTDNNGNLTLATQFLSYGSPTPVTVQGVSGSYVGTLGDTNIWLPFSWNPASTPTNNLWSFTIGPTTYSFDLSSLTYSNGSSGPLTFVVMNGTGTAHITGYDPTPASWNFTATTFGSTTVSFSSSIEAIPEPSSIALVGAGLLGLLAFKRRRVS